LIWKNKVTSSVTVTDATRISSIQTTKNTNTDHQDEDIPNLFYHEGYSLNLNIGREQQVDDKRF